MTSRLEAVRNASGDKAKPPGAACLFSSGWPGIGASTMLVVVCSLIDILLIRLTFQISPKRAFEGPGVLLRHPRPLMP